MSLISLKNIKKSYQTGTVNFTALDGVSFDINPGEMVAIMGPSGSGKSTTMHILGLLDSPESGDYVLNQKQVGKMNKQELARIRNQEIGFVFQSFNLLPRTSVTKNVELPLIYRGIAQKDRKEKVMAALDAVGLLDKSDNLPNQLSGGQIQRVAIARAIVGNPSILLADEPTGNLDSKTSIEVMHSFVKMNNEGKTVIMITHEHEIAAFCKRIITMRDGKIVKDEINLNRKTEAI